MPKMKEDAVFTTDETIQYLKISKPIPSPDGAVTDTPTMCDRPFLASPHLSPVKVLYMSGYTDDAVVHHGVMSKGMNYIQKPFTVNGLTKKGREVLDRSRQNEESSGVKASAP